VNLNFEELIEHTTVDDLLKLITRHAEVSAPDEAPDTLRSVQDTALPFRPTVPSTRGPDFVWAGYGSEDF
jgi:hypothetical protein